MNWKTRLAAAAAALCMLFAGLPAGAAESRPSSDYLSVTDYTVRKGGRAAEKVRKDDVVTVTATVRHSRLTTEEAGDVRVSASSDSFRFGKESGVSSEVTSNHDEPLTMKITFRDVAYKGTGDTLRFKLAYGGGARDDYGEVRVFECVEYEKPDRDSGGKEDDKERKETRYGAPVVLISRGGFDRPVKPGESFQLTVRLQNTSSQIAASNLIVSFEPSDGVTLEESGASQYLRTLRPRKTEELTVRLKANREISSPSQSVGVSVKFDYTENDERAQSTASERLPIPFDEALTGGGGAPTPNLIISRYDYGGQVAVGDVFDLVLEFRNTSSETPVENIVLTTDPTDGLSLADGSNTFYFPALGAGETLTQTMRVQAVPTEKPESPKIELSFKYEFLDGTKRTPASTSEKIAIPVFQPDRFQVSPPEPTGPVGQNEEVSVSLPYVNKGKGPVYNVEAELEGEIEALDAHQNLGNFEAGKSGSIDFIVTPREPGALDFKVKVSYEDANTKVKTLEFPVRLDVTEAMEPVFGGMEAAAEPEPASGWAGWAAAGGAAVLLLLLLALRRRRRRKKPAAVVPAAGFTWDEEDDRRLPAPDEEDRDEAS